MVNRADEAATQTASQPRIGIVSECRRVHDACSGAVVAGPVVPGIRVGELVTR